MLARRLWRWHGQWSDKWLLRQNCASTVSAASAAFSSRSAAATAEKTPVCWLDLRGSGLSVLERLLLEECLMHASVDKSWVIAGYHETSLNRYLDPASTIPPYQNNKHDDDNDSHNDSVVIVMGIGGKVEHVLDAPNVRRDGVLTLKRFSGGGTVLLDHDSIWTTFIGRPEHTVVPMFPRELMQYSADTVFEPLFDRLHVKQTEVQQKDGNNSKGRKSTLVMDTKSCGASENSGRVVTIPDPAYAEEHSVEPQPESPNETTTSMMPLFHLRENDYCLGERKMGGNAQSIGKYGWLHHTSFLWDYQREHMSDYLTLPVKRPAYREDRSHDDFLVKLHKIYPDLTKSDFVQQLGVVCEEQFDVERVTLKQAMAIVNEHTDGGGLRAWWETKSRTRILKEL